MAKGKNCKPGSKKVTKAATGGMMGGMMGSVASTMKAAPKPATGMPQQGGMTPPAGGRTMGMFGKAPSTTPKLSTSDARVPPAPTGAKPTMAYGTATARPAAAAPQATMTAAKARENYNNMARMFSERAAARAKNRASGSPTAAYTPLDINAIRAKYGLNTTTAAPKPVAPSPRPAAPVPLAKRLRDQPLQGSPQTRNTKYDTYSVDSKSKYSPGTAAPKSSPRPKDNPGKSSGLSKSGPSSSKGGKK